MNRFKNICIFCSSSNEIDRAFYDSANKTANLLVKHDCSLIFGGGMIGLMGELARVFYDNNKDVITVIPKKLNKKGIVYEKSTKIIETDTMSERKSIMEQISDAFIALAGGFGTLEELLEIITLKQLGYHNKPIAVLNTLGFYDPLINQLELLYEKKFAKKTYKNLYFISQNPEDIIDYLINYKPFIVEKKLQNL